MIKILSKYGKHKNKKISPLFRYLKYFFKKNFSLKNISLSRSFFLFAAISLIFILIVYFYFTQNLYSNNLASTLEKQSERIEKTLIGEIEHSAYLMQYLGKQIVKNDPENLRYIDQLFTSFHLNPKDKTAWNMFSFVDDKLNVVVNSNLGILREPISIKDRDYAKLVKANPWKIKLGKPSYGKVSHEWIIPSGMGIVDKNKRFLGVVVFGFKISKLGDKLWQSTTSDNISFAIFDKDLNLIINSNNFSLNKKLVNSLEKVTKSPENSGLLAEFSFFKDNLAYGFFQKNNAYSYIIVTQYEQDFLHKKILLKIYPYISGVFILLSSLAIFLFILNKAIINPIILLSKSAKDISAGNLETVIHKSKIKEINFLSHSISMIKNFILKEQKSKNQLELAKFAAEKANKSKTLLMRSITHDIKNYIFGISGLIKIILDKKSKTEILENEDLQSLETALLQSEELTHFVEDLLDVNQVESGGFSLNKKELCDISEIIHRMILLHKGLAIKNRVLLKTEIENDLPKLKCDVKRIKQIFTNLITNAIKYSKPDTDVLISAKHLTKEKKISVEIIDHGVGMNEKELELFFSGEGKNIDKSNLNKPIDSYGIGIATVLELTKLHEIKMNVASQKNEGTRVELLFDISDKEKNHSHNVNSKSKKHKTILLVEDNPVNIKITTTILKNDGYDVYYVENGKEALEILDTKHFDLILMDGEMPIMNGYKTAVEIRKGKCFEKFKHYKTIPIIALMSSLDSEIVRKCKSSGMDDFLEKSASKTKLLFMVGNYTA